MLYTYCEEEYSPICTPIHRYAFMRTCVYVCMYVCGCMCVCGVYENHVCMHLVFFYYTTCSLTVERVLLL